MKVPESQYLSALLPACVLACCSASLLAAELPTAGTPALLGTSPTLQTQGAAEVLPADQAFPLTAQLEADGSLTLLWTYAPHYYLYRKSLALTRPDGTVLPLELPAATQLTDEFFGDVAVYFDRLLVQVPARTLNTAPGATLELQLSYQGCAQDQYCYPPQQKTLSLQLPD